MGKHLYLTLWIRIKNAWSCYFQPSERSLHSLVHEDHDKFFHNISAPSTIRWVKKTSKRLCMLLCWLGGRFSYWRWSGWNDFTTTATSCNFEKFLASNTSKLLSTIRRMWFVIEIWPRRTNDGRIVLGAGTAAATDLTATTSTTANIKTLPPIYTREAQAGASATTRTVNDCRTGNDRTLRTADAVTTTTTASNPEWGPSFYTTIIGFAVETGRSVYNIRASSRTTLVGAQRPILKLNVVLIKQRVVLLVPVWIRMG